MAALSANHLQELADRRAAEASALLELGHFSGAYYLAGYALECGLKALIARRFEAGVIPDKRYVQQIYTHRLTDLLKLAEVEDERVELAESDPEFKAKWLIALDWSEESRYEIRDAAGAGALTRAILQAEDGVFQWIRSKW
ncbi:MAG: hypothetical protein ACOC71_03525 [Hyphomicrobiales bacterium]